MIVCSTYFLSNSVEMLPHTEFNDLIEYGSEKKVELPVGSDADVHHTIWDKRGVNVSIPWHMVY